MPCQKQVPDDEPAPNRYQFRVGGEVDGRVILAMYADGSETVTLSREPDRAAYCVQLWNGAQGTPSQEKYGRPWDAAVRLFQDRVAHLLGEVGRQER